MRRLAGGAGRRAGSEIRPNTLRGRDRAKSPDSESSQACADCASLSAVERREAQPLSPKGARVPGQASQTCLDRRAERALARPVRGLASPWRLPALHGPSARTGEGKRGKRRTRAAKTKNRAGGALAFVVSLWHGTRYRAVLALDMRQQPSRPLRTPSLQKNKLSGDSRHGLAG